MSDRKIKTRIQNKHDTAGNWDKATNFVPLLGEPIVFDSSPRELFNALKVSPVSRLKIGDGETSVQTLPFINAQNVAHVASDEAIVVHPEIHNMVYYADRGADGEITLQVILHPDYIDTTRLLANDYTKTRILANAEADSPLTVYVQCIVEDDTQQILPVITPAKCLLDTWCTDNTVSDSLSTVTASTYQPAEGGNPGMWNFSYQVSVPNDKTEAGVAVYSAGLVQIDVQLLLLDGKYWVTFDNKVNLANQISGT